MADGDVWRGFLPPLMSKRTTSMLITTKCAKFWIITWVLYDGSDEACFLLKTVHQYSCELWVDAGIWRAWPYGWYYGNSAQFMTSTSDRKKKITSTEGGVLWWKPRKKTFPVLFHVHAALLVLQALLVLSELSLHAVFLCPHSATCGKVLC